MKKNPKPHSASRAYTFVILLTLLLPQVLRADYETEVKADNPIAYWRLGELDGNTIGDFSGNGHDGDVEGEITHGEPSLIPPDSDSSIGVGGEDRIAIPGFEKFGEAGFSAEAWVKMDAAPGGFGQIFGDGEGGGDFNMMIYTGGAGFVRAHINTTAGVSAADSPGSIADGQLHHIVSTWDAATGDLNLYIDTELVATANSNGDPVNTDNPIYIGKDNREAGRFVGLIDEVALYDFPLSPERIAAHYAEVDVPPPPAADPHPDPGNLADAPDGLVHFVDFNEASGPSDQFALNFAYDRIGAADGSFEGGASRTAGAIGRGAAIFDNVAGTGVNVGAEGFETTAGIAIEAVILPTWSGAAGDYDEIFRKEDGGNRILLSFQNDVHSPGANPPVAANTPVLSFGLNAGGYGELDMPLDGTNEAGITLESLKDGMPHHVVANYDSATGEKSLWVDGTKAWSVMLAAGTSITSGGGTPAFIGNTSGGGEPFTGTIDEFAFWNRSLTGEEIASHSAAVALGRNYFQGGEVAATYAEEVLLDNPIAYWRLGDAKDSNVAVDASGNGHDATVENGALEFGDPSLIPPDTDTAVFLDGDSLITEPFDKADTGFTVEFWMQADAPTGGFVNLVGDGEGGLDFMLMVYMTAGGNVRPHVQTTDGFGSLDSVAAVTDGQLHHIVSTWDEASGEMILYIDGEEAEVNVSAGTFPTSGEAINDDNPIYIGKDGREGGWNGRIDEVAVYDYALGADRVLARFNRVDRSQVVVPEPHPDPGNITDAPSGMLHYVTFDEAAGPVEGRTLNFAYDSVGSLEGRFQGSTERVAGLVGVGAASFDNTGGIGVNLGADGFEVTTGITVEMLFQSNWTGDNYDEFFRKEDGGQRILLSYQFDGFNGGANPPVEEGIPVLSFGLDTAGYQELDMPLDGTNDAGLTVEDLADGNVHHIAATFDSATGEKTIWIDGVKAWGVNVGDDVEITSGGGANAFIGSTNGGEPFTGVIDEFAFWDRALTEEEIVAHAASGLAGNSILDTPAAGTGFQFTAASFDAATQSFTVTFPSRANAVYALEYSTDLDTWLEFSDSVQSGGDETTLTESLADVLLEGTDEVYVRVRR